MRRRRTNRSTWFPTLGTSIGDDYAVTPVIYFDGVSVGDTVGSPSASALVNDETHQPEATGISLRDAVEGQTYRCDRIVGNIFAGWRDLGVEGASDVIACAALVVLPVDDETQSPELTEAEYAPLASENSAQPWMWRRTWLLGSGTSEMPSSNINYGTAVGGPFVDTKGVKRIIQREQRLFLVTQVMKVDPSAEPGVAVDWRIDLRVLGQMVRKKNHSTFK